MRDSDLTLARSVVSSASSGLTRLGRRVHVSTVSEQDQSSWTPVGDVRTRRAESSLEARTGIARLLFLKLPINNL